MTGNKCWRCYCVWHGACWRVYCSFTSLSMTMTLSVTLGVLKSVLFIDITFNDHDTVWQRACWKVYCSLTSLPVTMTLCVTWGMLKSVLFIHITFNNHDTVCDIRHVEKSNVHSYHFQWPWHCVWHWVCWKVYCSFTSLSMTMTGNKCWRCYCVWHRACWRVCLPENDTCHWAAVWLNPSSRSVALWTDSPAVGYCAYRVYGPSVRTPEFSRVSQTCLFVWFECVFVGLNFQCTEIRKN